MQNHSKESKRGNQEIQPRDHTRNDHGIKEPEESTKNAEAKPRQTYHTPGQAEKRIHDKDKIIERIEEFCTKLFDNEQSTIIHTDQRRCYLWCLPEITSWEVEASLRDMKNGTVTGNDNINIET